MNKVITIGCTTFSDISQMNTSLYFNKIITVKNKKTTLRWLCIGLVKKEKETITLGPNKDTIGQILLPQYPFNQLLRFELSLHDLKYYYTFTRYKKRAYNSYGKRQGKESNIYHIMFAEYSLTWYFQCVISCVMDIQDVSFP